MENQSGRDSAFACAVVETNRNFRITLWSGEAEALYGWAEAEAKGRNIDELLRTEYAGGGFDNAFSALLARGWVALEVRHADKYGEKLQIQDTVTLLRDKTGSLAGMVHVLRLAELPNLPGLPMLPDLPAEEKENEPAASVLDERDRELLDLLVGTADDLWVYDLPRDGRGAVLSPKGPAPGEEGAQTAGMVHPDDWERVDDAIRSAMSEKREWFRVQCRTLSAVGEYMWSLTQGHIRYDEVGRPMRLSGMTIGVSEIRYLEDRLEQQAKALEKQSLEAADRNLRAAEFLSGISHDLKTPLSVMLMDLQMMERRLRDPAVDKETLAKGVSSTRRNALKLLRLIGNLLDVTRAEAGGIKARLVNGDVVETVSGVVAAALPFAKALGVDLTFESSCASRTIPLDADKLERILLNLLSNALKHTARGGHVLVRLRDAPDFVAVSVKDDGEGMPEDMRNVVFDRFKLMGLLPARAKAGSGLGLPLAYALVQLLRGRIWFESAQGHGCEFFVALPVLQPDWPAQPLETDGMPRDKRAEMELADVDK